MYLGEDRLVLTNGAKSRIFFWKDRDLELPENFLFSFF